MNDSSRVSDVNDGVNEHGENSVSGTSPSITSDDDVNEVLNILTEEVYEILGEKLLGFYLMGSLTYGDYKPGRSDIDFFAILSEPTNNEEDNALQKMHLNFEVDHSNWHRRIESQYVPLDLFKSTLPPKTPRPYYGEGKYYSQAPYGNEWLINNYLLYQHGITLYGKNFQSLVDPIDIKDVKKACLKDLHEEWVPKLSDPNYLDNPHYQSYVVLNICRILYTVTNNDLASKTRSAKWVADHFGQWKELVENAEQWVYGQEMKFKRETKEFINFALRQVTNYS